MNKMFGKNNLKKLLLAQLTEKTLNIIHLLQKLFNTSKLTELVKS